ncbi:MAG: hypothetical protein KC449_04345 [Anaerolineales bacterium]|nr:hypothetical protein [Anaerolineales bacterium]
MLQSFECPNCQANLDYDAQSEAITVRCAYCSSTVIVPDSLRTRRGQNAQQPEVLAEVVRLVESGRKIDAIKLFREAFNVSLKDAKDVIDAIAQHENVHLGGTSFHTGSVTVSSYSNTPTVQTSSGRGCLIFIVFLVVALIGVGAFLFIVPTTLTTSRIIEEVRSVTESNTETSTQEDTLVIVTTLEAIIPGQVSPSDGASSEGPAFAEVILQFGGEEGIGPGFFNDTRRLAVDGEGNIYTGDYSGGRIQVFDAAGKFLATWNAGEDLYMSGMTVDRAGTVYILKNYIVEKYNGLTGEFLGTLDLPGGNNTILETISTDPDGRIYIVGDERLVRLDNSGNIDLDIADPFADIPNFDVLRYDVAVDGAGNIILLGNESIYKLDANGRFLDQFGSKGEAEDQFFTSPTALAVDGKGRIFVNDFWGIKVFEGNGRYLATIESPGVSFDMLITDENDLLVMDRNSNEVRKYRLNQ